MSLNSKQTLNIELGTTPAQVAQALHKIKDAMVHSMILKIDATGIQDATDTHYSVYQTIYLEAVHQLYLLNCESSPTE